MSVLFTSTEIGMDPERACKYWIKLTWAELFFLYPLLDFLTKRHECPNIHTTSLQKESLTICHQRADECL